ncbi:hypothetical protein QR680_012462 [Steinernema hermaphroditum]|uniref:Protein kinase domain-containing protein n=1 Tax=Steinernema hermaphroditum TaxID=289476 RepID=A0AA39I425_9BILA|nr:hypothetical protein QR680_012462 [Steinernema hermaphroditum]
MAARLSLALALFGLVAVTLAESNVVIRAKRQCGSGCGTPLPCVSSCQQTCAQNCQQNFFCKQSCRPVCQQQCQPQPRQQIIVVQQPSQGGCGSTCRQACTQSPQPLLCANTCTQQCQLPQATTQKPIVVVLPQQQCHSSCQPSCNSQCVQRQQCAPVCEVKCVQQCQMMNLVSSNNCLPVCKSTCANTCQQVQQFVLPCQASQGSCQCQSGYSPCGTQCCQVGYESKMSPETFVSHTGKSSTSFETEVAVAKMFLEMEHTHVVVCHGFSPEAQQGLGLLFYALAPLGSLGSFVEARDESLSLGHAWTLFEQLLDGLAFLHTRGVFHRDVKPENMLLEAEDHVLESFKDGCCWAHYDDLWAATLTLVYARTKELPWDRAHEEDAWFAAFLLGDVNEDFWAAFGGACQLLFHYLNPNVRQRVLPDKYRRSAALYGFLLRTLLWE